MKSKFSGNTFNAFGTNLVCFLIILLSLGFATPWAICKKEKWYANHTIIDGRQLIFDGTGKELSKKFTGWLLLMIITLGIYSVWSTLKIRRWVTSHTHLGPKVESK